MKKWFLIALILIIAAIFALIFLERQEKKAIKVTLGTVTRGELSLKVRARAKIEAKERIELKAKRSGVVTFILDEGTRIKKGEAIAILDDKELLAGEKENLAQLLGLQNELNRLNRGIDIEEIEKRLEQARISYEELHRQFLNRQRLFESSAISLDEFKRIEAEDSKAKIAFELAEKQLQETKASHNERMQQIESQIASINANLSFIKQQLIWSKITSPIDGIIIYKLVKQDTYVQPSQILLVVASFSSFVVKSDIDETDVEKISPGMKADVLPDAFSNKTISGVITKIAPSPILQTKINAFEITVELEKTSLSIKSEMLCDLVILSDKRENTLKVPCEAILSIDKRNYIFVVQKDIARKKEVSLGLITPNEVEVLSGLAENDKVILNPSPDLEDKQRVRVNSKLKT
ncbi:MAG: efflux RND transporter periplasmic adaptor subunit [bacterium]